LNYLPFGRTVAEQVVIHAVTEGSGHLFWHRWCTSNTVKGSIRQRINF